jgi:hypothetical protein
MTLSIGVTVGSGVFYAAHAGAVDQLPLRNSAEKEV